MHDLLRVEPDFGRILTKISLQINRGGKIFFLLGFNGMQVLLADSGALGDCINRDPLFLANFPEQGTGIRLHIVV